MRSDYSCVDCIVDLNSERSDTEHCPSREENRDAVNLLRDRLGVDCGNSGDLRCE